MPVETPLYFAKVIQDHLALKQRNAELETNLPIDRYKNGDPFRNHPLFKTEEQARLEETMENVPVEAHMLSSEPPPTMPHDDAEALALESDDRLWSRSRDFDWGD